MERIDKLALGGIPCLGQGFDFCLQFLVRIALIPSGVVLGIVLGSVETGIELEITCPAHQLGTILRAPGIAVIALDKATGGDIRPVLDGQVAHHPAGGLVEDLLQGGEAIEGCIGVLTQNADLTSCNDQQIGVDLCKERRIHIAENGIVTSFAVDLHDELGVFSSVHPAHGETAMRKRLLRTVDGILVDAIIKVGIYR